MRFLIRLFGMEITDFVAGYAENIQHKVLLLRKRLLALLPEVDEQLDLPAKMIAYAYGQKYNQLICVLIPSKKGLKLGFNEGVHLPDPEGLLEGTGKISRYVVISSEAMIQSDALKNLILAAYAAYQERIKS